MMVVVFPPDQQDRTITHSLLLRATQSDEGVYYCMASKEGISVESNRATLTVYGENSIAMISLIAWK